MAQTLYDKLWQTHLIHEESDGTALIYIDRHLVHEVTSPQAFEGLDLAGRKPWRLKSIVATADHNVPTTSRKDGIADPISRLQVETLDKNIEKFGVKDYFGMNDARQGIVHVIGPEQGATLPGMTVVCGDSHTSTHGAFAALAFGIGTSEVEHVMATQCLVTKKSKSLLIKVEGQVGRGVTAKDIVLAIIGKIGTAGGTGFAIEFAGAAIRALSVEGRMTVCNMAIEAGARAGMIGADEKTIAYLRGRPYAPKGEMFEQAAAYWKTLNSDADAKFDRVVELDHAWSALNADLLDATLRAEFTALSEQLAAKVRATSERAQTITRWLGVVDNAMVALQSTLPGVAQGDVPPSDTEAPAVTLLELVHGTPDTADTRCIDKADAGKRLLALASSVVERAKFLQALPTQQAADEADEKARIEQWREFPEISDGELHTVLAHRFADWRNASSGERRR